MNFFQMSLQIAGTVKTNLMFSGLGKKTLSFIVLKQCSFKNSIEREKTFIAGTGFPHI